MTQTVEQIGQQDQTFYHISAVYSAGSAAMLFLAQQPRFRKSATRETRVISREIVGYSRHCSRT